jgi:di/tricarboxylate transporter
LDGDTTDPTDYAFAPSSTMTYEIGIVFALLVAAVVLFATEKLQPDIITLLLLSVLIATRILSPSEAFAGFSSEIVIILGSVFVLGGALQKAGVLEFLVGRVVEWAAGGPRRLVALLMLCSGAVSGFMNNTTVAAMFVAPVTALAKRSGISASKLLMPMAFAVILGGTCTLIGTSTNMAVSGYLAKSGLEPLHMFELAPIGGVLLLAGVLFMVILGDRLLPGHPDDAVTEAAQFRQYLAEVAVLGSSPLVGARVADSELARAGFRIVQIVRNGIVLIPDARTVIEGGDTLVVEGDVEALRRIGTIEGLAFRCQLGPDEMAARAETADAGIADAVILPRSELAGSTLQAVDFRQRYGLTVLAINRGGQPVFENLADVTLREGDVLLLHGDLARIEALQQTRSRLQALGTPVETREPDAGLTLPAAPKTFDQRRLLAPALFGGALLTGALGWVPTPGAFLIGAVLVIVFGCLSAEEARACVEWRMLILVGGMTAFGLAMDRTGAAQLLAQWVVAALAPFGVLAVLGGFFLLTVALTQPMSNAAAALVVVPVAINAAQEMGANERTFAIAVMLAASISFIAPLEPACALVYGPGKYRFRDFIRVGGLLTLFLAVLVLVLLPVFWKL